MKLLSNVGNFLQINFILLRLRGYTSVTLPGLRLQLSVFFLCIRILHKFTCLDFFGAIVVTLELFPTVI